MNYSITILFETMIITYIIEKTIILIMTLSNIQEIIGKILDIKENVSDIECYGLRLLTDQIRLSVTYDETNDTNDIEDI